MPKSKASKVSKPPAKGEPVPKTRGKLGGVMLHLLAVVVSIGGLIWLVDVTKKYVENQVIAPTGPLKVALVNKPTWMSDYLAQQIAATVPRNASSAFDHELLVQTVAKLKQNPWVSQVHQIRRVYGDRPGDTLEVDCEFRAPIALVKWGQLYSLVDNEGVLLPEQFTERELDRIMKGRDGRTSIRVITGVHQPPPDSGTKWAGADLAAGLELVKLFYGKLFLDEVTTVDVSNFGGRVKRADPQLVLLTRHDSQIWWGRPLNTRDFFVEIPVARKLEILRAIVQQHGRIDANQAYVDVRYDDELIPTTQPAAEAGTVDGTSR